MTLNDHRIGVSAFPGMTEDRSRAKKTSGIFSKIDYEKRYPTSFFMPLSLPLLWNRLRYSVWAPVYDVIARAPAGFDEARRRSIDRLQLAPGQRVLIVGAGT